MVHILGSRMAKYGILPYQCRVLINLTTKTRKTIYYIESVNLSEARFFKALFQKLTDVVCIISFLQADRKHEDSSIICIISFISVVFQRLVTFL